jgi:hypothetical protein
LRRIPKQKTLTFCIVNVITDNVINRIA